MTIYIVLGLVVLLVLLGVVSFYFLDSIRKIVSAMIVLYIVCEKDKLETTIKEMIENEKNSHELNIAKFNETLKEYGISIDKTEH